MPTVLIIHAITVTRKRLKKIKTVNVSLLGCVIFIISEPNYYWSVRKTSDLLSVEKQKGARFSQDSQWFT